MDKRYFPVLFLILLFMVNVPVSAGMAAPSPAPAVSVVCTPPVCPTGGTFSCPPAGNGCPGGCGFVCTTPTIACTPPPCPTGGTLSCPMAGNGCPGGCSVVCVTPTTPQSAGEPVTVIGGIALCLFVIGKKP